MKSILIVVLGLIGGARVWASAYTTITDQHADLEVVFAEGSLSGQIHADHAGVVAPDQGLLYDGPEPPTGLASPGGIYSFLGVGAGETVYVWPQDGETDRIYLGFAAQGMAAGTLASYFESDPRVGAAAPWIKISLADVRYHAAPGESGPAHFSVWQSSVSGGPTVWMSTAEGGITADDATWMLEGGHVHYNWGFSKRGHYEIDFVFSAFANGTNTFLQSEVQTFHFGVEFLPDAIPEPGTTALLGGAGMLLLGTRRRRSPQATQPFLTSPTRTL